MSPENVALVGLFDLQVLIAPENDGWIAQGLEIDYAVGGASVEDAQTRFEEGLLATVHAHLEAFGDLSRFVRPAPLNMFRKLSGSAQEWKYTCVSLHRLCLPDPDLFPFGHMRFVSPKQHSLEPVQSQVVQ